MQEQLKQPHLGQLLRIGGVFAHVTITTVAAPGHVTFATLLDLNAIERYLQDYDGLDAKNSAGARGSCPGGTLLLRTAVTYLGKSTPHSSCLVVGTGTYYPY